MGRYYIDRTLFSTDIYILDFRPELKSKYKPTEVEINDKDLKALILKERANGREVNLLWKKLERGRRKSQFQEFIEKITYNRVMNSDE